MPTIMPCPIPLLRQKNPSVEFQVQSPTTSLFNGGIPWSHGIVRSFNRCGPIWTVALDRFDRVWHAAFLHRIKSCRISAWVTGLNNSFVGNRHLRVVRDEKCWQEYPINGGVTKGFILDNNIYLTILSNNDLLDDVICNIVLFWWYNSLLLVWSGFWFASDRSLLYKISIFF